MHLHKRRRPEVGPSPSLDLHMTVSVLSLMSVITDLNRNRADEGSLRKRVTTLIDLLATRSDLVPAVQGKPMSSSQHGAAADVFHGNPQQQPFPDLASGTTDILSIVPPSLPSDIPFFNDSSVPTLSKDPLQARLDTVIASDNALVHPNQPESTSTATSTQGVSPVHEDTTPSASVTSRVAGGTTSQSDRLKASVPSSLHGRDRAMPPPSRTSLPRRRVERTWNIPAG